MMSRASSLPAILFLMLTGHAATSDAAHLAYTMSSEMLKPGCEFDKDGDCLDDAIENQLAQSAVPWYFYDEEEHCAGWWQDRTHFGRRDFFQVRPHSPALTLWKSSGTAKWLRVTYFWLHPHDCQDWVGFGGHLGDSEHVYYNFYSYDLKTWYLYSGTYYHHGDNHTFSGDYFARIASELGTAYASVAADEDGHGSWPGWTASSADCAGDEDSSSNDCFVGTMQYAFNNQYREIPYTYRNIGGPAPERWNQSIVGVSGSDAYSQFDVGHGVQTEYWTSTAWHQQFCGWECSSRYSDGSCTHDAHADSGCASGLHEKLDYTRWALTACGDATCNGNETCSTCSRDCGVCPGEYCGNGICGGGETCSSCDVDCGPCEPPPGGCLLPPCLVSSEVRP